MYMHAWEKGLKTTYYLRSMGATRIEKSTLDITKYDNVVGQRQRDERGRVIDDKPVTAKPGAEPVQDCESCQ